MWWNLGTHSCGPPRKFRVFKVCKLSVSISMSCQVSGCLLQHHRACTHSAFMYPRAESQCLHNSLNFISSCEHQISQFPKKRKYSKMTCWKRDCIHPWFFATFCYNLSTFLLVVMPISSLFCKLNFTIGVCVR